MHSMWLYSCLVTLLILKSILAQDSSHNEQQKTNPRPKENVSTEEQQVLKPKPMFRHRKMFNILKYPSSLYSTVQSPVFHPYDYLTEIPQFYGKDITTAESSKLISQPKPYENSPTYYIKLPPTPYMYIPGMGYISEPSAIAAMHSQVPSKNLNSFFNLPLNFMSNGRPSNIYQFGNDIRSAFPGTQYFREPAVQRIQTFQSNNYPSDTKIMNLKENFLYNGRPEEIFVLPNEFKSYYQSESNDYY